LLEGIAYSLRDKKNLFCLREYGNTESLRQDEFFRKS
jgi:hypothetical protein